MAIDNNVLKTVLHFSGQESIELGISPGHVIYGYARLLCMSEPQLKALFSDAELDDLNRARYFFSDHHLDLSLIKTGMPLTFRIFNDSQTAAHTRDLLLAAPAGEGFSSEKLLNSLLPEDNDLFRLFTQGNDLNGVMDYCQTHEPKEQAGAQAEDPAGAQAKEPAGAQAEDPKKAPGTAAAAEAKASGKSSDAAAEAKASGKSSAAAAEAKASANSSDAMRSDTDEPKDFRALSERFRRLRLDLLSVVKGQNYPVQEFVRGCYQAAVVKDSGTRAVPEATFLFVGPPGVGKTLLAETAADSLGRPSKTFNMSEYSAHDAAQELIGTSQIYSNNTEGVLLEFVRKNPRCILIFDEIEKAHRSVIRLFLQILDLGYADNKSRKEKTSFKDAIIIFTSNACGSIYNNSTGDISHTPKPVILDALKHETDPVTDEQIFPDAICSRIASGSLIMFNHLSISDLTGMISDSFDRTAQEINRDYGYQVTYDPRLPLFFLFHHGAGSDARIASRQSSKFIKNELYELSLQLESHQELLDGVSYLNFTVDTDSVSEPELKNLFVNDQQTDLLVVCDEEKQKLFALPESFHARFASTPEEIASAIADPPAFALIDPLFGLNEESARGISLDDRDSIGIRAYKQILDETRDLPVYIFETMQLEESDRSFFISDGAAGFVSIYGPLSMNDPLAADIARDSITRQLQEVSEKLFMEQKAAEFSRRGNILEFNTAQIRNGSALNIQFYELTRRQAIDTESAGSILSDAERPDTLFKDVIGASNAKDELQYFIRYLSNPRKFVREGGKPAKGLLLYGPPGTGKTMLARAMAGESDVSFLQTSATEFMNKWVGESEANVRRLFERARKYAPAIIFIDEIDAIGKTRTGEDPHTESVLNALLTELDGFKTDLKKPVFVLAATNYSIESNDAGRMGLDPALVRRFDNRIKVDLPNEEERVQYLKLAMAKKGFDEVDEATVKNVASRTPGLSIAILQNVIDLAFRNAGKEGRRPNGDDLQNALEEYSYGEKHEWAADYYRAVAIHESGHAYLAWISGEKPSYMTIESRGDFGGYMAHESGEKTPNYTREALRSRIRCSLGGRAAEEVFFGREAAMNTGASSDLNHATKLAISMICDYGMLDDRFIALPFNTILQTPLATAYLEQANTLLQAEMAETLRIVTEGRDRVEALAEALLAKNHLTGDEIQAVLEKTT